MSARDVATTVGGLVAVAASALAGLTIWMLLTAPTTLAGVPEAAAGRPLQMVARLLYDLLERLVRYF